MCFPYETVSCVFLILALTILKSRCRNWLIVIFEQQRIQEAQLLQRNRATRCQLKIEIQLNADCMKNHV